MRPTAAGRRTTRACWRSCCLRDFSTPRRRPVLLLLADQGNDLFEARSVRGGWRYARLHRRGSHDAAFQDLAVQVHLPELSLGIGFVAPVNHEVLDHQALRGTDAKPEFRGV